jgi:hypothetical protein
MNTITCPDCGNQASAFGTVENCWCDKMYCDHTRDMFASYKCACGSSGDTPQAKQHRQHQESKFQAEMAVDVEKLLGTLPAKITGSFQTQSLHATGVDVQVVFINGRSATITVSSVYSKPPEFQVTSGGQPALAKGGEALRAVLTSIAGA